MTIQRSGETATHQAATDDQGQTEFTELLPGRYRVTVLRLLDGTEAQQVSDADPELAGVNALGGGGSVDLEASSTPYSVDVVAGRRGSLVISEIYDYGPVIVGSSPPQYTQARYVEVSNNGDTTIYLDGKLLANGLWYVQQASDDRCTTLAPWRLDPEGIWSEWHLRFPGSGRQHPIRPGEAKVIATQALDHDAVSPGNGLPDLSAADFEVVGTADTDNPAVPNMIHAGFRPNLDALGAGFIYGTLNYTAVLVDNVDLDALPTDRLPLGDPDYRRFPAASILDVASVTTKDPRYEFCEHLVHPSFDRQAARIFDARAGNSVQRRVMADIDDGHALHQRTLTTAADVERGARSPGSN